jgi:hypothetical protein
MGTEDDFSGLARLGHLECRLILGERQSVGQLPLWGGIIERANVVEKQAN